MDRKGNKDNYRSGEKRRRSSSVPYRRRGDNSYGRNDNRAYRLKRNTSDDGEGFYESDSMFFKNSAVNGDVSLRTDRADDFFENKNYTPWDNDDEFNRSNSSQQSDTRIRKKSRDKLSVKSSLKSRVEKVSERVFSAGEDEEDFEDYGHTGIAEGIKSKRKNRKLLDELQGNKKPLTRGQRKLKNILMTAGIVAVILVIGIVLSVTVLFKCEKIIVEGTTRYSNEVFLANKSSAKKRIEEEYPYIENAKIGFSVPDTITIKVTEAVPEYYIQDGTRFYMISKNSKILEQVVKREFEIPNIVGCRLRSPKVGEKTDIENDKVMTVIKEIAASIDKNRVIGIKEILNYDDRIKIVIGMPEYVDYKIRTAMTIIMQKLSEDDKGRLNCSNLIEGRTDNKDNASYFQPNRIVATEAETQPSSVTLEQPTQSYQQQTPDYAEAPKDNGSESSQLVIPPLEQSTEEQTHQENYGGEFSPQTDTVPAEASTGEDVIIKGEIT